MKYKLFTYGCQMNDYDSDVIAGILESMGADPTENESDADIIVLNTCCVRKKADDKVYGKLGLYKHLKKENPHLIIVVAGCLAQKDGEKLLKRFPHVDLVAGTHNLHRLKEMVDKAAKGKRAVETEESGTHFINPAVRKNKVTAYIPVSIGCDCYCTYCIVPYVRGRLHSRPVLEIIQEVEKAAAKGYKEIFLLGQNVNTYGFDLPEKPSFTHLLSELNGVEGVKRIRFISPHPKDFPQELIKAMGTLDKVCESVHLPLQAGSDKILKLMNRRYNTERFRNIITQLRNEIPHIAVSTDLITGFPGETDEDFEEGLRFIEETAFDHAFMFAYSPREGTAAAKMTCQVPQDIKMERLYRLIEIQNRITRQKNENLTGQIKECLVESISKKDHDKVTGRTRCGRVVNFTGNESMIGSFVLVKLEEAFTWGLKGTPIKASSNSIIKTNVF